MAITIEEAMKLEVLIPEMLEWPLEGFEAVRPPKKGAKDFNTEMSAGGKNFDFNIEFNVNGTTLRTLLHHASIDCKTNWQNANRPKPDYVREHDPKKRVVLETAFNKAVNKMVAITEAAKQNGSVLTLSMASESIQTKKERKAPDETQVKAALVAMTPEQLAAIMEMAQKLLAK